MSKEIREQILQKLHTEIYTKLAGADISSAERIGILEGIKYCLLRKTEEDSLLIAEDGT